MKSRRLKSAVTIGSTALAAAMLAFAAPAAATTTTAFGDGTFATNAPTGSFITEGEPNDSTSPNTTIPDWEVTSGSVDWMGTYWQEPPTGGNSIDMNGTTDGGASGDFSNVGVLSQTFTTVTDTTYFVAFDLAGNPVCSTPKVKAVLVQATGGAKDAYVFDATNTSQTSMGWETAGYSFMATGTSTTLTFASNGNSSGTGYEPQTGTNVSYPANISLCGAAIGDVVVTPMGSATGANCKDYGYKTLINPNTGTYFTKQGHCVSYFATQGDVPIGS